jgi:hypothetical protein
MMAGLTAFFVGLLKRLKSGGEVSSSAPIPQPRPAPAASARAVPPVVTAGGTVAPAGVVSSPQRQGRLSFDETLAIVRHIIWVEFPQVDERMVMAMIQIESAFNPRAYREEKHLNDASYGLMQTLWGTARWLHDDMGKRRYSVATPHRLYDPHVSIYFGCAMVNWLRRYRGQDRSEDWVVMSYNGGPGADNSQTQNHLRKYREAKAAQEGKF